MKKFYDTCSLLDLQEKAFEEDFYISIITLDQATISIIKGEYLLDKTTITKNDTYTTSNTFVDEEFSIELFSGEIFIIKSI